MQTDSIRDNLDPRKLFSDTEIEKALADSAFYNFSSKGEENNKVDTIDVQEASQESNRTLVNQLSQ